MDETPEQIRTRIDDLNEQAWAAVGNDTPAAAELAEASHTLATEHGGYPRGLAWSLLTLGVCAWLRGDHSVASEELTTALELFIQSGDRAGEASARNSIGIVHKERGEFSQAIEHYRASLEIQRECGNRGGEANALGNIGIAHYSLGEYPQAQEYHRKSLCIQREIGNRSGEASTLNNIGLVHYAVGEYPQALQHYHAGLTLHQENGNRNGEANALNSIGLVHSAMGEHDEALRHYQASLAIYREIGNRSGEATALGNIGMVHQQRADYASAVEPHQAALAIFRETGGRMGEAQSLVSIASTLLEMGDITRSLEHLAAARQIALQLGSRTLLCDASIGTGRCRSALGEHKAALQALNEALTLVTELGEKGTEVELQLLIANQCEMLGDTAGALSHLRRHLELQKEVFSEETRRTVRNLRSEWQMEVSRKEAEIERLRNVELKEAFDRLEQAHAGLGRAHAELEQTHAELKSTQLQLVQSEKMASLGQLTAGIAHEINNPINFVSASVGPLRRDLAAVREAFDLLGSRVPAEEYASFCREHDLEEIFEELGQLTSTIESGAKRTVGIVDGLRSFARLDESGLKSVDIHEGLDAALAILAAGRHDGIEVKRTYGNLPAVECYPGEINQAFMNILTNAIKAIEGEPEGVGIVSISTTAADDHVTITIGDTGCGMTPDVQSRIFDPFFTTRDVGEGRGLGLSIAWGIIEKHGGRIDVASVPEQGSVFTITLPVVSLEPVKS